MRALPLGPCYSVSAGKPAERRSSRPSRDWNPRRILAPQPVVLGCCQRLERLSGLGTHLVMAAFHSTGASKRLSVVTLRIRRYTSLERMPALRARLPRTKENSLLATSSYGSLSSRQASSIRSKILPSRCTSLSILLQL